MQEALSSCDPLDEASAFASGGVRRRSYQVEEIGEQVSAGAPSDARYGRDARAGRGQSAPLLRRLPCWLLSCYCMPTSKKAAAVPQKVPQMVFGRGRRRSARSVALFFRHAGIVRNLDAGDVLITQGAQNESLYLLVEGELESMRSVKGRELESKVTLAHKPGELIGFESFVLGALPAHSVRVRSSGSGEAQVIELKYSEALGMLETDANLACHLFHEIAADMAERIRTHSQGLRGSVMRMAPAASSAAQGIQNETRMKARTPMHTEGSHESAGAARFVQDGVSPDEQLLLSCSVVVTRVEKNSKGTWGGTEAVQAHPFWHHPGAGQQNLKPDWEMIGQARLPSPLLSLVVDAVHTEEQAGESKDATMAVALARSISHAEVAEKKLMADDKEISDNLIAGWDFVSPTAIAHEYLEQMSSCVSAV
jgi:CRP-like cAMP-binding protein